MKEVGRLGHGETWGKTGNRLKTQTQRKHMKQTEKKKNQCLIQNHFLLGNNTNCANCDIMMIGRANN